MSRPLIDHTGQVFDRLTVVERAEDYVTPKGKRHVRWRCRCECGTETLVLASALRRTKSCGCLRAEVLKREAFDRTGLSYGWLFVLCRGEDDKRGEVRWRCRCKCGREVLVLASSLAAGRTISCGCYRVEQVALKNKQRRLAVPGYKALHHRLARAQGKASLHPCVEHCGRDAKEWSYDHSDPNEIEEMVVSRSRGLRLVRYSIHLDRYSPRCGPCHHRLDKPHVQAQDERAFQEACDRLGLVPRKDGQRCRAHRACAFSDDDPDRCPWCHSRWASIRSSGGHTCTEEEHLHEILRRLARLGSAEPLAAAG